MKTKKVHKTEYEPSTTAIGVLGFLVVSNSMAVK